MARLLGQVQVLVLGTDWNNYSKQFLTTKLQHHVPVMDHNGHEYRTGESYITPDGRRWIVLRVVTD